MSKEKNCETCKRKGGMNSHHYCIPCKRGKHVKDHWVKKEK